MRSVNADDSDLTIRSCDGQLFRVHARNLYEHSDGFPGSDVPSQPNEVVDLTETSETLEILFQFMYRRPQPELRNLPSAQLYALADAVDKYGVFPAQQVCNLVMAYVSYCTLWAMLKAE